MTGSRHASLLWRQLLLLLGCGDRAPISGSLRPGVMPVPGFDLGLPVDLGAFPDTPQGSAGDASTAPDLGPVLDLMQFDLDPARDRTGTGQNQDPCGRDSDCAPGLYCEGAMTCTFGGGRCEDDRKCPVNEICRNGNCQDAQAGDPCVDDARCALGAACVNGACGDTVRFGASCSSDADCGPSEACGAARTTPPPDANVYPGGCQPAGELINTVASLACVDSVHCPATWFCHDNACLPAPVGGGNPCLDDSDCATGYPCNKVTAICTPP